MAYVLLIETYISFFSVYADISIGDSKDSCACVYMTPERG